jgi:hypothetical protein
VQCFIIKRHIDSKSHSLQDYIKIKEGEKKVSLWSTLEDQKKVQSPRKKYEDTYEVRV